MPKVSIVHADDRQKVMAALGLPEEIQRNMSQGELDSERWPYFPREGETLELYEVHLHPHTEVNSHAHTEDEIIYVLDGEIRVGRRVLGAGAALYVEHDTLYAFSAGASGVRFLNFRPRPGAGYLTKSAVVGQRRAVNE